MRLCNAYYASSLLGLVRRTDQLLPRFFLAGNLCCDDWFLIYIDFRLIFFFLVIQCKDVDRFLIFIIFCCIFSFFVELTTVVPPTDCGPQSLNRRHEVKAWLGSADRCSDAAELSSTLFLITGGIHHHHHHRHHHHHHCHRHHHSHHRCSEATGTRFLFCSRCGVASIVASILRRCRRLLAFWDNF